MPRPPKIWWHTQRKYYCVKINGKQVRLSAEKKEAQQQFHKLMAAKHDGQPQREIVEKVLACEVCDKFLLWCYRHRTSATADAYKKHLERFLRWVSRGRTMKADELRPYHVIDYVDSHDWSDSYRRGAAGAVQRAFKWAVMVGLIDNHPCVSIPKPKSGRRETPVTEEEYRTILNAADESFGDVVTFAWETGARPQEVRQMKPGHVRLDEQRVVFPTPEAKGKRRPRLIYLNTPAMAIVERRLQAAPEWVFTNRNGRQWTAYAWNCRFVRLKAKLGRKACLYDVRHAFGTRKLLEGHSVETVAALMGHQSAQMLHSVYGHLDQADGHLRNAIRNGD